MTELYSIDRSVANRAAENSRLMMAMFFLLVLSWSVPILLQPEQVMPLVREDGFFETTAALLFLISAIVFFASWLSARRAKNSAGLLLLAALMFFAGGEEISWGQRIFGWSTPEGLDNIQNETTIHNLRWFDKTTAGRLSMSHMFEYFCIGYGFLLPLLERRVKSIGSLMARFGIPLVPLSIGAAFPINYLISKIYQRTTDAEWVSRIAELRECTQAFVWFVIACVLLLAVRKSAIRSV